MDMAIEVMGDIFPEPPSIDFSKLKTRKMTAQQLEAYTGYYWDDEHVAARRLYVKNDTLRYQTLGSTDESPLVPLSENTFQRVVNSDDVILVKFRKEKGTMKLVYTSGPSDEYVYEAYNPINPSAAALSEFTGTYYCEALKTLYTVSLTEKGLVTSNRNQPVISFTPIQADLFLSSSRNFGGVRFVRNNQQAITGFYLNSDRIKNLYFEKVER